MNKRQPDLNSRLLENAALTQIVLNRLMIPNALRRLDPRPFNAETVRLVPNLFQQFHIAFHLTVAVNGVPGGFCDVFAAQFLLPAVRVNVVPLNLISGSCGAENEPPRKLKIRQTEQIVHGMIPFLKIVPDNVALSAVILKNNAAKHPAINIKSMQKL